MTAALDDDLTFEDLFCGAGGSIRGLVDAGFKLVLGVNHSPRSIETVSGNHPNADFLCTDINHLDMRRLPRTRVLWASVICTEVSPAGGRQARRGQGILEFEEQGHVPSDVYERTRACALDVVRATEVHRYEAVVVENVVEFATKWELYDWWVDGMCKLGYRAQVVNASAAHVYDDTNAGAITGQDSHALTSVPLMVNANHDDTRVYPAAAGPLPSRTTKIGDGIASVPFVTMARTNGDATGVHDEPLRTIATGNHHYLTTPPGAFLVKNYGGNAKPQHLVKRLDEPLGTITTQDHHWLVIPYRKGARPRPAGAAPLPTISTVESAALLHATINPLDCFYRMLKPREHARGQRFPDTDVITGNIGEQTMQAGNAVPCNVAQWIGQQLRKVLDGSS